MSEPTDEPTEPVEAVDETEPVAEPVPAEPARAADDPVRTVTRKGATVAIAGALVVGGLAGWVAADAFGDDDEGVPISAFQEGGGRFHRWGGGPMERSGQGFPGFPGPGGGPWGGGGGFPGGPGGGWHDDGERPPWMDERPEDDDDDGDDDRGGDEEQDQDEDDGGRESPTTTTEGNN
jgi:hypothetical protein